MAIYLKDPVSGKVLLAKNASAPSCHNNVGYNGKNYDWRDDTVYIDSEECEVWSERRWGKRLYIHYNDKWYTVDIYHAEDTFGGWANVDYPDNIDIVIERDYPRPTEIHFTITGDGLEIDVTPGHLVKVPKAEYDDFKASVHPELEA